MYLSYYKESPYWPKSQNVSGRPLRDIVANIAIFGRVLFMTQTVGTIKV